MKWIVILLNLSIYNTSNSQNTFLKTYDLFTNEDDQGGWIELSDDSIYVINNKLDEYSPVYRKFDLNGNHNGSKNMDHFSYFANCYLRKDSLVEMIVKPWERRFGDTLGIYNFELNGDSITINYFSDPQKRYKDPYPIAMLKTDKHYIIIANTYLYNNPDTLDAIGTVWYINHDFTVDIIIPIVRDVYTYSYGAHIGPDSNLYVFNFIHCQNKECDFKGSKKSISMFKHKELLKEYFTEPYSIDLHKPRISLVTSDTSLIYGFERTELTRTRPSIRCIDKNGNFRWEISEHDLNSKDRRYTYIEELKNGDFLAIGYTNSEDFLRAVFLHRIDKYGNTVWERTIGKHLPNIDYGAEGYVWKFQKDEMGFLYVVGQLGGETNDMLLMKLDSFGCINQDKCNQNYVINPINGLHKYDQLNMQHKKWYYTIREQNGNAYLEELEMGEDTIMFDNKYGIRNYKHVWYNNSVKDSFKVRWDAVGKLNYIKNNPNLFDDDKDSVLYDFTLVEGDKFQLPQNYGFSTVIKVDTVDLLDGYKRKRLTLKHDNAINQAKYSDLVWIEGIGSPNGLFYFYDWINGTKTTLNCYFDRDMKRWGEREDCTSKEIKNNVKYVSSENIWNVGPVFDEKPSRFTFSSDSTLINDKYYFRKLYSSTEHGGFDTSGTYYREENGLVYQLDLFNNKEKVVFNFQLNVGDSITVKDLEQEMKLKVIKIDSVIYNDNIYRRRTTLKCENNDEYEWIEGFGTTYLIYPYCYLDNSEGTITCFYVSGNLVFENDFDLPCWYLGVGTEETKTSKISIYPNPAKENLIIKSDNTILQIKIYNIDGKLNGEYKTSEISLENYEKGIYIIEVIDIHNIKSISKFIKM